MSKSFKTFEFPLVCMVVIDKALRGREARITFESIGWKSLLQLRAGTSKILVPRAVVRGLCLEREMPIYSYVGVDCRGRPVMVSYLDGKPRMSVRK